LVYEGASGHGEGTFFDLTNNKSEVHTGYFRYGPIVNWLSNSLAEIKIPTGSPNYHSNYYNCKTRQTSPPYSMPIAVNVNSGVVATIEQGAINFFHLNNQVPFYTHTMSELGLAEYFIYCNSEAYFESTSSLVVTLSCKNIESTNYVIKVPNHEMKADEK
jgi:hypothetical protein